MVIGDPCCAGTFAVVDFSVPVPGLTGMGWDSDEVDSASDAHDCAVGCAPRAGTSGGGEVADCVPVPDELVGVAAVSVPGDREDCASRILGAEMVGVCPMMTAAAQPDTVRKTAAAAAAMIGRRSHRHWRFSQPSMLGSFVTGASTPDSGSGSIRTNGGNSSGVSSGSAKSVGWGSGQVEVIEKGAANAAAPRAARSSASGSASQAAEASSSEISSTPSRFMLSSAPRSTSTESLDQPAGITAETFRF